VEAVGFLDRNPDAILKATQLNKALVEGRISMPEDVFPIGDGPSLKELMKMESDYAFQCADCHEIFASVVQWVQHALDRHSEILPGVNPVKKQ
jgi:hypothetical protein